MYNLTKKLNAAVNNVVEVISKLKYRDFAPDDEEDASMGWEQRARALEL